MSAVTNKALEDVGLIPDVLDEDFAQTIDFKIQYSHHPSNAIVVGLGTFVEPRQITHPPIFTIDGDKNSRYTLIAVDPDMPDPEDPRMREWVNWLIVNIPGDGNLEAGRTLFNYSYPNPGRGKHHRLMFIVAEQEESKYLMVIKPSDRANFDTREFLKRYKMKAGGASFIYVYPKEIPSS